MLAFIVRGLDLDPNAWDDDAEEEEDLFLVVLACGKRHTQHYHVPEDSYPAVGETLLWALEQTLGDAYTDDARAAWTELYQVLARTMIMGGRGG
jgi:hemoglobin-like flavoprotein